MNNSKFVQTEGYPLTADRLQELQTTFQAFNSLSNLAGDLTIVSGCEVVGTDVKDGFIIINGELLEFRKSAVSGASRVIIIEEKISKPFKNGTAKEVYIIRYATFGTADISWLWTDFKRPIQTKELEAMFQVINTSLTTIKTKLDTIEEGAKVQLQADWNQNDTTKKDYIKGKPPILNPFLHKGEHPIGDIFDEHLVTITFPDVGTSNYVVLGGILSKKADWHQDSNVWHQTREHTSNSFKLMVTELAGGRFQDISFQYVLVKL